MPKARRLPLLLQAEAAECGIACLAMIASAHGHELDLNEMRHRFRISMKGTTLRELVAFAKRLGFSTRPLRLEPAALSKLACPAILHMDMNHFMVLKEVRGGRAFVHDPALGFRVFDMKQLDRRFTGIALELTPADGFKPKAAGPRLRLRHLLDLGGLPGRLVTKALLLSFVAQALLLSAPLYVQLVIDRSVAEGDAQALTALLAGFLVLLALRAAVGILRAQVLLTFSGHLSLQLAATVVRKMLRLPHSWFQSRHIATLLSRLSSTQPIRDLISEGLAAAVVDGTMSLLTVLAALLFAPGLAAIMLAGFVASVAVKAAQIRRARPLEQEYVEAFSKAQQEFIESVRGIAAVKLFRKEDERERRWANRNVDQVNARYAADRVKAVADVARELIQGVVTALVVYAGAVQVIAGSMSAGVLVAFITYQQMFTDSSARLLDFGARFRLLDVHVQRLADVLLAEEEEKVLTAEGLGSLRGAFAALDLAFRYADHEPFVFRQVSLSIGAGEFVAITGPSGCGKSTLLKVLIGLLEPVEGSLTYDSQPTARIGWGRIRDSIGVVMQDDVLMSGSIAQNITFFDTEPDLEWMQECARIAAIDEDVSAFPMGYHTLIGDLGSVLSGGQRQRLLLARALYRKPAILFMDEGTSNLDTDKEREVNSNIDKLAITRVVIAHRKETIAAAMRQLELTPGGLVERRGSKR